MIFVQGQGLAFIRQIQKEKPLQKLDLKKLLFDLPSPTLSSRKNATKTTTP